MSASRAMNRGASRMKARREETRDIPSALKGLAKFLCLTLCCGLLAYGAYWISPKVSRPVEHVVLEGDFRWLDQGAVHRAITENLTGTLLSLDIGNLREKIRQVPWVEDAEISRVFPSSLVVHIKEERPIVQWNDQGYISSLGEFIKSPVHAELAGLPKLSSELPGINLEQGAHEAIEIYHLLNSAVLVSGESIEILRQDASGGWIMIWQSGLEIDLGRSDHLKRVRHALAAWQRLPVQQRQKIGEIDARYDNGVAVRERAPTSEQLATDPRPARGRAALKTENPV